MSKQPKIIKANLGTSTPKLALPTIPDLILNFASNSTIFTLRVPSYEMGNLAKMFCKMMKEHGVTYTLEEKPRQ